LRSAATFFRFEARDPKEAELCFRAALLHGTVWVILGISRATAARKRGGQRGVYKVTAKSKNVDKHGFSLPERNTISSRPYKP
jgi:hypothetical protein